MFHTHVKQRAKLQFSIPESLHFCIANLKTKDSALNDSKHSLTAIGYYFLPEYNFDSLRLFPNI